MRQKTVFALVSQWIVKPGHDKLYMLESQGSWFDELVSLS